ncbi:MAG: SpoIIE family protein phosphatase [Planctomycetota bacterium]
MTQSLSGTAVAGDSRDHRLYELVSLATLQNLQDRFAALGRMTVCIATTEGDLITRPTWGSRFSELIGASKRGQLALVDSIRTGSRSPDVTAPVTCHEGMLLYTTPIRHDGRALGLLAVGTRTHPPPPADVVRKIASAYDLPLDELLPAATLIDPDRGGTPEAIHRFADILAHIIATLYGQAERIARQLDDLRTVHGLADLLSGTLDLQAILNLTVRRVVEVMPVKACAIRLLNPETGELVIKAVHNLSEEYLRKGPVLLAKSQIDGAAFAGQSVYIEDAPTDPRIRYPDNARREGIVSGLCVPLTYRGQTIGIIRVYTAKRHVFSESEESLLRSIGSQAASAIIHSRLYAEQVEGERVQRQVEAAAQIQRRMLPLRAPTMAGLTFGCVYDPTLQVGGDFYDFIELPQGYLGVCIADVVGKGMPAALMMASIRSAFRAYAPSAASPAETVAQANRHMYHDTPVADFATLAYGVFSPDGRNFAYCNAGHLPPLLLRGERFTELTAGGLAIGIQPDETFEQETVALRSGDLLVMVTDGVTEAMDFQDENFGRERLLSSIWRHRRLEAQQLAGQILWDVRRFVGLADQSDDITVVVVKAI